MDLSGVTKLRDSDVKLDSEISFKLYAGPGAGKTRFLINHIKNVIADSSRLTNVKKIACITYTNIGVETITNRLDNSINEVEVSTIHSFLYKHVIKPYLWVLNDEYDIPLAEVDGHDEIIPTYSILKKWLDETNQQKLRFITKGKDADLKKDLTSVQWKLQSDGSFEIIRESHRSPIPSTSLMDYKKICWKKGLLSHDDVLFLSHKILKSEKRILDVLRAKFPYIFIDEFQDTNPIQSEIIRMIGERETIIGVIGDFGQSIFSFQGADVQNFLDFKLKDMNEYKIENNYRSTEEIIKILNHIRKDIDFKQASPKNKRGNLPQILIGGFFNAYHKAKEISGDNDICTLSYTNSVSNIMKYGSEDYFDFEDINEPLYKDNHRGWLITFTITAIEYGLQNKIKDAIKYMRKAYRKVPDFDDRDALINLQRLVNCYDEYNPLSIKDFYNKFVYDNYGVKEKISRGAKNKYYESLDYRQVAVTVRVNGDDSLHRTIHKSKGDDFDSVLLIIPPKENLDFLLNPNIGNEKHRIYYVALSRAIKNLFINVQELSKKNKEILEGIGFEILELDESKPTGEPILKQTLFEL